MNFNKNIINGLYDHWKIIFQYLVSLVGISFIGSILFYFWGKFRDVMLMMVPLWIILLSLGILITIIVLFNKIKIISKKIYSPIEETILINNLIYKVNNTTQAFCPFCFEKDKELKRMKRYYSKGEYYYRCFVCDYNETVSFEEDKNPDSKYDIPF
jgi:hypothetical protein